MKYPPQGRVTQEPLDNVRKENTDCRAQCSNQSPTQRAAGCSGALDFSRMLPSAWRSATMAGAAKSVSGSSRRLAATCITTFPIGPSCAGQRLLYARKTRIGNAPISLCANRAHDFRAPSE